MFFTQQERSREEIELLVGKFGHERKAMMKILQSVQKRYGHISKESMQIIADCLDIQPVELYSFVSFYDFLYHRKKGRVVIRLCRTISCDMQGKDAVARQLCNEIGIQFGETTSDGQITLEWGSCMGMCDQGPTMLINHRLYSRVSPENLSSILEPYLHRPVPDVLEFDDRTECII
jgi:[NiFe] hydrogenase diaphorase moiety large subunit